MSPSGGRSSSGSGGKRRRRKGGARGSYGRPLYLAGYAVAAVFAVCACLLLLVYPGMKGPGSGKVVTLVVVRGDGTLDQANRLGALGLVSSPKIFALFMLAQGWSRGLAPGPHLVTDDLSPGELLKRLQRFGLAERVKVTFPEGYTRFDMARRLEEKRICAAESFLAATVRPELLADLGLLGSAEGYLFPATYDVVADTDPEHMVRRMKSEFDRRFAQVELGHSLARTQLAAQLGWGTREIVTLASMIEKEAVVDEERPLVAAVFVNRLREPSFKRKVLQCDPTAGYGCLVLGDKVPACAGYTGKITHEINAAVENTYSTYTHEGLPPGPIANPGAKSLAAALKPATTRHFYFVARGGGRHTFSETYDDHNAAVKASNHAP